MSFSGSSRDANGMDVLLFSKGMAPARTFILKFLFEPGSFFFRVLRWWFDTVRKTLQTFVAKDHSLKQEQETEPANITSTLYL